MGSGLRLVPRLRSSDSGHLVAPSAEELRRHLQADHHGLDLTGLDWSTLHAVHVRYHRPAPSR